MTDPTKISPRRRLFEEGPEAVVRQAVVPASLFTSLLGEHNFISVDTRPLVIHVLRGLEWAGIRRAVVVLGKGAEELETAVRLEAFEHLRLELIWGDDFNWGTSLANSIMAARSAFAERGEPLLIVRAVDMCVRSRGSSVQHGVTLAMVAVLRGSLTDLRNVGAFGLLV